MSGLLATVRDDLAHNPQGSWAWVGETRKRLVPALFGGKTANRAAFDRSVDVTLNILKYLEQELNLDGMCPGHGPGHWMRDYVNACRLLSDPATISERTRTEVLAGFAGGVLHDIGNAVVDRYHDDRTPVRHAEVAGLLLGRLFMREDFGLSVEEQLAIKWAVMAHTHYLKPVEMQWNGEKVIIDLYQDMDRDKPLYGVWFPRMIDRLDCSGAETFPARHYLTLHSDHKDYDGEHFFDVDFRSHIRPIMRSPEQIKADGGKQTMLEHLRMFAGSQTNDSPYGKHDYGHMLWLRDDKRSSLMRFLAVMQSGNTRPVERAPSQWLVYLSYIEPSMAGARAADALDALMRKENVEVRTRWAVGFDHIMSSYEAWCAQMGPEIDALGVPTTLPFVGDIHKFLGYRRGTSRLVPVIQ